MIHFNWALWVAESLLFLVETFSIHLTISCNPPLPHPKLLFTKPHRTHSVVEHNGAPCVLNSNLSHKQQMNLCESSSTGLKHYVGVDASDLALTSCIYICYYIITRLPYVHDTSPSYFGIRSFLNTSFQTGSTPTWDTPECDTACSQQGAALCAMQPIGP